MRTCPYCKTELIFLGMNGRKTTYARSVKRIKGNDIISIEGKAHDCGKGKITRYYKEFWVDRDKLIYFIKMELGHTPENKEDI